MYESDLCSHEKARKLRALLLSGLEVNSVSGDGDGSVEPLAANSEVLVPVVDSLLVLETVGSFTIGK